MRSVNKNEFEKKSFAKRLTSMLGVDLRRMFGTPMFYIMLGISFVVPVLVLVMTSAFGGTDVMAFANTWQIIASTSDKAMVMDMTTMMNINLMYFLTGIYICLFVSQDFSSGFSKNLFTVRVQKNDYVISKTLIGFIAGILFLLAFLAGSIMGGKFAGLSFDLGTAGIGGLIMCMLAKVFLTAVFAAIFVWMSVFGKERTWLSICLSLFGGALLYMMVPMMTPLDSGVANVGLCLAGGSIFACGIGLLSQMILQKTSLAR